MVSREVLGVAMDEAVPVENFCPRLHGGIYPRVKPGSGELTYLYQDDLGGRFHEFDPEQHQVISLIDGSRTLEEIAAEASQMLDAEVPPEFIEVFVGNLEQAKLLSLGSCRQISPDNQTKLVKALKRHFDADSILWRNGQRPRKTMPEWKTFSSMKPCNCCSQTMPLKAPGFWKTCCAWLRIIDERSLLCVRWKKNGSHLTPTKTRFGTFESPC